MEKLKIIQSILNILRAIRINILKPKALIFYFSKKNTTIDQVIIQKNNKNINFVFL